MSDDTVPGDRADRHDQDDPAELRIAGYLKERVYATFTGLAIVLVVSGNADHTASAALFALVIGVLGITLAGFVSDIIASLAVHRTLPDATEMRVMVQVAWGALATLVLPTILIVLGWVGVFSLDGALRAATIAYLVTLVVISYLAVRRAHLRWYTQLLALGMLVVLGALVVGLQTLAHSV
jgi:hypothetical protein